MTVFLKKVAGIIDQSTREALAQNKSYVRINFNLHRDAELALKVERTAMLIFLTGFFGLIILGASYSAEGRDQLGKTLTFSAVPLSILTYDCYQACENFRSQVQDNPEDLMEINPADQPSTINHVALRKCLLKKTIFFEPFLNLFTKICMQNTYPDMLKITYPEM